MFHATPSKKRLKVLVFLENDGTVQCGDADGKDSVEILYKPRKHNKLFT